ncbi:MAG: hypothetical protein EAZ37_05525 [Burkholderiales bacterium]|nr:MAG: hypothetical protein EAZ37_05525 [Burkholderiales bacterium]
MDNDPRCCGTGMCIIDPEGNCWCGQKWDGEKMCRPSFEAFTEQASAALQPEQQSPQESAQKRS